MQRDFAQPRFLTTQIKHFRNFQITFASFLLSFELGMPLEATGKSGFQLASERSPHFSLLAREFLQTLKLKVFQTVFMKVDKNLQLLLLLQYKL